VTVEIEQVSAAGVLSALPALVHLLDDAVASGASIGFLAPLDAEEAAAYWRGVADDLDSGSRLLLAAREGDTLAGTVQLELAGRPNAAHRAEVQKLIVLTSVRKQGIGWQLMEELERGAREMGRTLLVLDTRQGDAAERLYRRLGYQEAGVIPGYARSSLGTLDGTVYFYKQLA
jgi:ribosomal protein S18 acetylase RimI-like enzyme